MGWFGLLQNKKTMKQTDELKDRSLLAKYMEEISTEKQQILKVRTKIFFSNWEFLYLLWNNVCGATKG